MRKSVRIHQPTAIRWHSLRETRHGIPGPATLENRLSSAKIPKAYTKPWSVTLRQQFAADTELIDEICAEGEKFSEKLK
jgi:hypothetical protein